MKLYNYLFEGVSAKQFPKNKFGIVVQHGSTNSVQMVMFSLKDLELSWQRQPKAIPAPASYIAGMIAVGKDPGQCLDAYMVQNVVRGPRYPGAGLFLYAAISKVVGDITSDRHTSTSDSAKNAWDKIVADKQFVKTGWLDNHTPDGEYVDVFDDRSWEERTQPRTPEKEDDCKLPDYGDIGSSVNRTGTGSVWRYKGNLDVEGYVLSGKEFITGKGKNYALWSKHIIDAGIDLFVDVYQGTTS